MKRKDMLLAILTVIIWGANFTVIKIGLDGMPAMLLVALRYTFTSIPAILFVQRPNVAWYYCLAYGLAVGVGQFASLFYAMEIGMTASIASIVTQSQVFFTILFGTLLFREKIGIEQVIGLVIAALGLLLIGGSTGGTDGLLAISLRALAFTLLSAAFWSFSNMIVKLASARVETPGKSLDTMSLLVWSSLVPPLPLLALALMRDTPATLWGVLSNLNPLSIFSVAYLAGGATLVGYGVWNSLLSRYPAGKVAPLSFLVPITGLITAQIVLGEELTGTQWLGGLAVLMGLLVSNFGQGLMKGLRRKDVSPATDNSMQGSQ